MAAVKLHVYDISRGMARQLSMSLIGRQLDGIWHTGVYVFGREYFFGSFGIDSCPPGGTILGPPGQVVDCGTTYLPREIFLEYLDGLANTSFRGDKYHLLEHNCNTFSAELVSFLTGREIPGHITGLPAEVLRTPFGAMIRPLLDSLCSAAHNAPGPHADFSQHSLFSQPAQQSSPSKPPQQAQPSPQAQQTSNPSQQAQPAQQAQPSQPSQQAQQAQQAQPSQPSQPPQEQQTQPSQLTQEPQQTQPSQQTQASQQPQPSQLPASENREQSKKSGS